MVHGPRDIPVPPSNLLAILGPVPLGSKASQPLPLNRGSPLNLAAWEKVLYHWILPYFWVKFLAFTLLLS